MDTKTLWRWTLPLAVAALAACSSDPEPDPEDTDLEVDADVGVDVEGDADDDVETDAEGDTTEDTDTDVETDTEVDTTEDTDVEEDTIEWPDPLEFNLNWPIFDTPSDPLAETDMESCALYQEERCDPDGHRLRCAIYDIDTETFNDAPNEMLERAYLYDRWYDLYHQPDGQTGETVFKMPMAPGTPEEVWGAPENFAYRPGLGDSCLWTGTALNAFILRYLHTGTEADYQRMEEKTWAMLHFFDVTGIPGYIARNHYLLIPEGEPVDNPDHYYRTDGNGDDHRDIEHPEAMDFLPDDYFAEHPYASGEGTWVGTPRWYGDPSIDQMNGPMVAFPMVYGLLRDEDLKAQIAEQMICYLHRLRRIEIRNLQDNQDALDAFQSYFAGGVLDIDADDIDFSQTDTIVMYVHPQINTANEDTYDRSCHEFIETEPWRVIDATSGTFLIDVLTLVQDIDRSTSRENQINHFYIPSIRGGDAVHMMHLVAMAYAFTGDERYADFLTDELLGNIRTAEVADTMSALILPHYCRRFYGTNIIAGPLWAFNNLLADSELGTHMQEVMVEELWAREAADIDNLNIALMFAGTVSPEIGGEARQTALDLAMEMLPLMGGTGGILNDPRRNYRHTFEETVAAFPEGTELRCPTEEERATCEREIQLFGTSMPGENISHDCDERPGECVMDDGLCTVAEANVPLPNDLRRSADYVWQRNPFEVGEYGDGSRQFAGVDYTEQYWMARFYEFLAEDTNVLAWRDTGELCE